MNNFRKKNHAEKIKDNKQNWFFRHINNIIQNLTFLAADGTRTPQNYTFAGLLEKYVNLAGGQPAIVVSSDKRFMKETTSYKHWAGIAASLLQFYSLVALVSKTTTSRMSMCNVKLNSAFTRNNWSRLQRRIGLPP